MKSVELKRGCNRVSAFVFPTTNRVPLACVVDRNSCARLSIIPVIHANTFAPCRQPSRRKKSMSEKQSCTTERTKRPLRWYSSVLYCSTSAKILWADCTRQNNTIFRQHHQQQQQLEGRRSSLIYVGTRAKAHPPKLTHLITLLLSSSGCSQISLELFALNCCCARGNFHWLVQLLITKPSCTSSACTRCFSQNAPFDW